MNLHQCTGCGMWLADLDAHDCDKIEVGTTVVAPDAPRRHRVGVVALVLDDGLVIVDYDDPPHLTSRSFTADELRPLFRTPATRPHTNRPHPHPTNRARDAHTTTPAPNRRTVVPPV